MAFSPLDNGSVFFRRLLSLLMGALILSAALTVLFYSFASDIVFSNYKAREFNDKAAKIAEKTVERYWGNLPLQAYDSYMNASTELLNANVIVYMYKGNSFEHTYMPSDSAINAIDIDWAKAEIAKQNYKIMDKRFVSFQETQDEQSYLFIGYPIVVNSDQNASQSTSGSIFLISSMTEIKQSYTSLNFALILASTIVFLLVLIPLVFISQRLISPLVETKNVALAMSRGDFSKRAKTNSNDEIGELAKAVNNLADDLDKTLKNLIVERTRLQQILNGLGEGILAITKDFNFMHVNPALADLFHLEGDNQEIFDKVLDICKLKEPIKTVLETAKSEEINILYKNRNIAIQLDSLYDVQGKAYAVVALFRDTTEAEQLEQTRRDYVSNVSHELRTPLTAVRALVEPLQDGIVKKEEDRQRYYGIILNETLRLSRLIDDMMALSRLQSASVDVSKKIVDAKSLLETISYKYENQVIEQEIYFDVQIEEDNPILYTNEDRIEQILVIFLDNAMKFTPKEGTILVHLKRWDRNPKKFVFVVEDSGKGIDESDIEHIFDRFYKTNKSRGRSEGTGLGLSIAKEISIQMQEKVWAESVLGHGSKFFVTVTEYKEGMENEGREENK